MKKLIAIVMVAVTLSSCQKELSYEGGCGKITEVSSYPTNNLWIEVEYHTGTEKIPVQLVDLGLYHVGDQYCKK